MEGSQSRPFQRYLQRDRIGMVCRQPKIGAPLRFQPSKDRCIRAGQGAIVFVRVYESDQARMRNWLFRLSGLANINLRENPDEHVRANSDAERAVLEDSL